MFLQKKMLILYIATFLAIITTAFFAKAEAKTPQYFGPHLIFELETGKILKAHKAFDAWYPASLTKMMTAYVTFQAIQSGKVSWDTSVIISSRASKQPPSKSYLPVGTAMSLSDALKFLMVKSANDIAVALAEAVSGSEAAFVQDMNNATKVIGMKGSFFTNAHGLPDKRQITTAYDMAKLAYALSTYYREYSGFFAISSVKLGKRTYRNFNLILDRYQGAIGYKTGYICASGYNLVSGVKRGNKTLIAVVLGARSGLERAVISKNLLDEGLKGTRFFGSNKTLQTLRPRANTTSIPFNMRPLTCKKLRQKPTKDELAHRYGTALSFQSKRAPLVAFDEDKPRLNANTSTEGESDGANDISTLDRFLGPRLKNPAPIIITTYRSAPRSTSEQATFTSVPLPAQRSRFFGATPSAISAPSQKSAAGSLVPEQNYISPSSTQTNRGGITPQRNWPLRLEPPSPRAR